MRVTPYLLGSAATLVEADPGSNFSRIVDSHRSLMDALVSREAEAAAKMLAEQFEFSQTMFLGSDASQATRV